MDYNKVLKKERIWLKHLIKYIIFSTGGIIIFFIEMILIITLKEVWGLDPSISYALVLIFALILLFNYHKHITFKNSFNLSKKFIRFVAYYSSTYFLVWFIALILIQKGFHYIPVITTLTLAFSYVHFIVCKKWIFNEQVDYIKEAIKDLEELNKILKK